MNFRKLSPFIVLFLLVVSGQDALGQSLDGLWEITAVIDNGRVIDPTEVLQKYAADGRVVIRGQQVELVTPMTYQRKQLPFAVDVSKSPMTFDMAGAEKTGGRGIFMTGKDALLLCLASRDQGRPATFASLPGSGQLIGHPAPFHRHDYAPCATRSAILSGRAAPPFAGWYLGTSRHRVDQLHDAQ